MNHKDKFKKKVKPQKHTIKINECESVIKRNDVLNMAKQLNDTTFFNEISLIKRAIILGVFNTDLKSTIKDLLYFYQSVTIITPNDIIYYKGKEIDDMNNNQLITTLDSLLDRYEQK